MSKRVLTTIEQEKKARKSNNNYEALDLKFNNYNLISLISQGNESLVYAATNNSTGLKVVIKTPVVKLIDNKETLKQRITTFNKEVSICAQLYHPNIVQLIDKGVTNGIPYAVFEYIPGISLKDKLRDETKLEPKEAVRLMTQVLDALQCIHAHGIVHRDLKPQNIMLTQTGLMAHCKLLDFDAAEADFLTAEEDGVTTRSVGAYTAPYAAPEILRGEPVSTQADYYSWGLILAECLTGQQVVTGHVEKVQTSPLELSLPAVLDTSPIGPILKKAIRKNAKHRYQQVSDIASDLTHMEPFELLLPTPCGQHIDQPLLAFTNKLAQESDNNETTVDTPILFNHSYKERKHLSILCINLSCHRLPEVISPRNTEHIESLYDEFVYKLQYELLCDDTGQGFNHLGSLGDLLLFQFGYPVASDNDSRLAARLALDMMSEFRQYKEKFKKLGCSLEMRTGLHYGEAILDDNRKSFGNTINTAVKLSRQAASGAILCTTAIQKNLKNYYHFSSAACFTLGFTSKPESVFLLNGERQSESIGFLRGQQSQYQLIGRENELACLKQQLMGGGVTGYRRAYLFGEAGIGKSCLVFELLSQLNDYSHSVIQFLPETQHDALAAVLTFIKRIFSLDEADNEQAKNTIRQCLKRNKNTNKYQTNHIATILGGRLGVNFTCTTSLPPLEEHKFILFEGLSVMLTDQLDDRNKLFVYEDLHWADITSLEFIAYFSNHEHFSHHTSLCTSRETTPKHLSKSNFLEVPLKKLNDECVKQLAFVLFGKIPISEKILVSIISRADGIPFFIEELVQMLKDKCWIEEVNGEMVFSQIIDDQQIPNTLRESLQQKLDALTHAKSTAQLAATIGREFDRLLLEQSSNRTVDQIRYDINELINCGLITPQRRTQTEAYLFEHALVRDVAYQSMLETHRQAAHCAIAHSLEKTHDTQLSSVITSLSHHFFQGRSYDQSFKYSKIATDKSLSINEHQQVIHYAGIAFTSLEKLPNTIEKQLEISQILTTSKMMTCGWSSPETEQQITTSQKLLWQLGKDDIAHHFSTCWSLATYYNVVGNNAEVLRLTSAVLKQQAYSEGEQAAIYALRAHTYYLLGSFKQSVDTANKALHRYNPQKHKDHATKYGHDTKVLASSVQVLAYGMLGDYQRALDISLQTEKYAIELDNPHSQCMSLVYRGCLYYIQKNPDVILPIYQKVLYLCEKYSLSNWPPLIDIIKAWATNDLPLINQRVDELIAAGATQGLEFWLAMKADCLLNTGEFQGAIDLATATINTSKSKQEDGFIPELEFILGKSYIAIGEHTQGQRHLAKAIQKSSEKSMMGLLEAINCKASYH